MFGARKDDLPNIWEELNNAGFESGHAYGKSLRTVKSCVGTTCKPWKPCSVFLLTFYVCIGCRYGIGDSVGLAVQLENRYRGVRSPHKFKGGVSGCVRECAEAQVGRYISLRDPDNIRPIRGRILELLPQTRDGTVRDYLSHYASSEPSSFSQFL
jgi:NAD(P)H-nitrite reductase large subunit